MSDVGSLPPGPQPRLNNGHDFRNTHQQSEHSTSRLWFMIPHKTNSSEVSPSPSLRAPPQYRRPRPCPAAKIGIFYTQTIQITGCSGSTYSFAPVTLPPGLTLDISGNLTGTPTKAGTYSIQVFITDQTSGMVAAQPTFSLTIVAPPAFSTTSPLPGGIVGIAYSQQIVLTGGVKPYSFRRIWIRSWPLVRYQRSFERYPNHSRSLYDHRYGH